MSNKFSAFEFTDEGLKVISDVLANQGKMSIMSFYTFDKVITKQLEYDQIQTNNPKQFKPVGTVTAKPNNTVESRLILDNLDVTNDYSLKSIALIGQYNDINFVLGVIFTNEATTIPKYDGISGQSIALDVSFAISDTSIVTINTQLAGMLTVEDYVALMKYIDSKDALKADDDKVVHLFSNEKIDGIKTFLNTIIGSVSGNSGTTNRVNTLDLNTSIDLNKIDNGLYLATSLDKTTVNKPTEAGEVYVLVVESYEQRFIDLQTNKQYYRSINGSIYNEWERFFTVSEMNNLNADLVHKTKDESVNGQKTFLQRIIGSITGTAGTAIKLLTGRNIQTNLSSTNAAQFDGSSDVKPGVIGTLPITNGGTGTTTGNAPSASKLSPGRKINGVVFDGSKDINVTDPNAIHKTGNETVAGTKTFTETLTQNLTAKPNGRIALYNVADGSYSGSTILNMLRGNGSGRAVGFGSGGLTIIGGGEAATSYLDALNAKTTPAGAPVAPTVESSVIVSDSANFFISGYQNGGKTGNVMIQESDGSINKMNGTTKVSVINKNGVAISSMKLANARRIGGVLFDGTANINLPGVNVMGNQSTTGTAAKANVAYDIASTSGTFQMWYGMKVSWHKSGRVVTIKGFLNQEIPAGKHLTSTEALPDFLRPAGESIGSVGMWGKDIKGYMFIETTGQMSCDDGMYSKANLNWTYIAKNANMK